MFYLKNTTREIIEEYRNKNEISMFEHASGDVCRGEAFEMQTFQIEDEKDNIVAFSTVTCENQQISIGEFEVLESQRGKGIGKNIIFQLQRCVDCIELYPGSEGAKLFWERCGFVSTFEDGGAIIMHWSKSQ